MLVADVAYGAVILTRYKYVHHCCWVAFRVSEWPLSCWGVGETSVTSTKRQLKLVSWPVQRIAETWLPGAFRIMVVFPHQSVASATPGVTHSDGCKPHHIDALPALWRRYRSIGPGLFVSTSNHHVRIDGGMHIQDAETLAALPMGPSQIIRDQAHSDSAVSPNQWFRLRDRIRMPLESEMTLHVLSPLPTIQRGLRLRSSCPHKAADESTKASLRSRSSTNIQDMSADCVPKASTMSLRCF
jgi:hypothetical protein